CTIVAVGLVPRRSVGRGNALTRAQPIVVSVAHGIARPRAVFAQELVRIVVSVSGGPDAVHHIRHAIEEVVKETYATGVEVVDGQKIAGGVILKGGCGLGCAGATGKTVIGIVKVSKKVCAEIVRFGRHAAKGIEAPLGALKLGIDQVCQVASGGILKLGDLGVCVCLGRFSGERVIGV